jgi:hypothetical protein
MSKFTPDDFVEFMFFYLKAQNKELNSEPPQATTYTKTSEFSSFDFPHLHLSTDIDFWSFELQELLAENPECDGFCCWMILEHRDLPNVDQVLLVVYDKHDNTLDAYMSEKDLSNFELVNLNDELPCLVADYSEPVVEC